MRTNEIPIGKNRTGIELSPLDKRDMLEVTEMTTPSTLADGEALAQARAEFIQDAEVIGSVPPPASAKGVVTTGVAAIKGVKNTVWIDKLGERLAFERTGIRLYEAVADKCEASEPLPLGPTLQELRHIQAEELAHFDLVREAMSDLGADPTAMTPSADLAAVQSLGLIKVVRDARTSFKQSLEAMLVAELIDNDGWSLLIELTRNAGNDELAERFEAARVTEQEHLEKLRRWVRGATVASEKPLAEPPA
ncbi:MAG TPA: ferritin-like domain-containing protein [Labilithrix sp.]|nr:ferritin-like domain-containing protein [Labilithrix sp.]